jgi:hypothetical protein
MSGESSARDSEIIMCEHPESSARMIISGMKRIRPPPKLSNYICSCSHPRAKSQVNADESCYFE